MNTILTDFCTLDDARLVALHFAGDRNAFAEIVARYQATVCALAFSACGDLARSEDLAQDVFLAAWRQLPELREPAKLRPWLCGIARNLAHNAARRQERVPTARAEELSLEQPADETGPREQAIGIEEAALMWRALEDIPEIYREPMVLFYREQRSTPAVAATLEISEDLVRQRLARGRAMLTERMAAIVEETLERTGPTAAFTGGVIMALPWSIGAAAAVELGLAGAKSGSSAKALAVAGGAGSAMAKGGMAVKAVSIVALLPALLNGAQDYLRFRGRHLRVADQTTSRSAAWSYVLMQTSLGLALLSLFVAPGWLITRHSPMSLYVLWGSSVVVALWTSAVAGRRLNRSVPNAHPVLFGEIPAETPMTFELRATQTLLGLPLVHVRLGGNKPWHQPVVKGWIAVSDGRSVGGFFAMGLSAVAPVSLGIGSVGALSLGLFSLGVWALGGVGAGWASDGIVVAGWHAAKGVLVVAKDYAASSMVSPNAIQAPTVDAFFRENWFYRFAGVFKNGLMLAAWLGWVMPVVLMSGHLWRTRAKR